MGEVINLRKERKRVERKLEGQRASANRVLHGRTKAERSLEAARKAKAARDLGQHRIEKGDER
jgi:hypothetical protein